MRIAVVSECFLPEVNGVTNSVLRVLEHLEARGHETLVVAPGPGPNHHGSHPVVRVPSVPLPCYRSLRVGMPAPAARRAIDRFQPDVVHVAAPAVLGASFLRHARDAGVPSVAIYQTDLVGFAARYGLSVLGRPLRSMLRHVHSTADLTLAPSSAAVWQLRAAGVERVARWARGVDISRFHPRHRSEALRASIAPGAVLVGTVGRLAAEKRIELLAPLSAIDGVHVVVVGDGPRRSALERALPDATFLGFRSGQALSQAVASLDVFVHAGADETFCQAIQEAMGAGVPVVAPASGGPLDLVRHGDTGYLFPADDPVALRCAVEDLVSDPVRRQAFGRRAHGTVAERTWTSVGDDLIRHYESVTTGGDVRQIAA